MVVKAILSPSSLADYRRFLAIKGLPRYRIGGCVAEVPDEYAERLGMTKRFANDSDYKPTPGLFDYQRDLTAMAVRKRKFAIFADCGLGKTLMLLDYARHVSYLLGRSKRVLIVSPLMVVQQTINEANKFYGGNLKVEQVKAADLNEWLAADHCKTIGITNYEAITDEVEQGKLGALILDESSMLKSHYGKWGTRIIELGKGLDWKLCLTGTPAPNDRIEFANHAVFLDRFPTVNSFLARFFINRGQTQDRWELKGHALRDFYKSLSDWCVFLSRPGFYGWKDNAGAMPPINVTTHSVKLTDEQQHATMNLTKGFFSEAGGFVQRGKLSRLAKGIQDNGEVLPTLKYKFICDLVKQHANESIIIWCWYNAEQDVLAKMLPDAASISGNTPMAERERLIAEFKAGKRRVMISKAKVLGFGLNLQIATRQIFSSLVDSYESYYQCIKRSNRIGSTQPLSVDLPVTEIEYPMVANVLRKAARVQADTEEQERLFKEFTR